MVHKPLSPLLRHAVVVLCIAVALLLPRAGGIY